LIGLIQIGIDGSIVRFYMKSRWFFASALLTVIFAIGCGGGGSPESPPPAPTTTGKPWPGRIIVMDWFYEKGHRVDLGANQLTELPFDDVLRDRQASWTGYAGGKLLLLYASGGTPIFFYDANTLQKAAPDYTPRNSQGALSSMYNPKASRDGVYFAACWDGDGFNNSLGIFRVDSGSYVGRLARPPSDACLRFDWLNDQRLVYDSGSDVVVTNGDASQDVRYPYPRLPDGWVLSGSQFSVDRPGTRIIWAAKIPPPNDASSAALDVLVVANIDGTSPRQLTDYPESDKRGATPLWDGKATWSPDGRFIAFTRATRNAAYYPVPGGGSEWIGSCTPVIVIPDTADKVVLDVVGSSVDEALLYTVTSTGKHLTTCAPLIWTE
jgi:hypothetical protein